MLDNTVNAQSCGSAVSEVVPTLVDVQDLTLLVHPRLGFILIFT
jgi:hypothetical protein